MLFGSRLAWSGEMSSRSRPSSKRSSKASKQSGLLESLTRTEKRAAVVEESDQPTGTVIDLDDDDPVSEKVKNFANLVISPE